MVWVKVVVLRKPTRLIRKQRSKPVEATLFYRKATKWPAEATTPSCNSSSITDIHRAHVRAKLDINHQLVVVNKGYFYCKSCPFRPLPPLPRPFFFLQRDTHSGSPQVSRRLFLDSESFSSGWLRFPPHCRDGVLGLSQG